MISIDRVTKVRRGSKVLSDVSFEARSGRVTGFVGPNGAGKTTTLRILLGLDFADGGNATFNGLRYGDVTNPLRKIGAVLDGSGANRTRTAHAHLRWVAASAGVDSGRIQEVLELAGIANAAQRRVGTFSLGMSRRLGIAAALIGDPEVLILDEPINGLDPEGIRWVRNFLRKRADEGRTVLLSSHMMRELAETVDDIVIINDGRIVDSGSLRQVVGDHGSLEEAFFARIGER
ncbi:ABC-2 type transport system ATP-binding protein [Tsukamurella pulmonis]|uniref:ABC-2 type transport system ATP-binding protein n=1 Tax=Tsukamurella pulmonis TaxID=47312 RepID=A0A1H1HFB0_9ACTN|nr:ATP-binding cassette domain-containing protein [Tsukamurella pulmonis]SDR24154.1 ABC-2 type transport system ATP-binding protein [Tsukamurella pulmonis]